MKPGCGSSGPGSRVITSSVARMLSAVSVAVAALVAVTGQQAWAATDKLDVARVYFEFNATDNDLGVHIFLDGEDWRTLTIVNPEGTRIFEVEGTGPYAELGLTELFFEGAEPSLDDVPLDVLLALFPEGIYRFSGETVDGDDIVGMSRLTHAIPDGPRVFAELGPDDVLVISWEAVTEPPEGFPGGPIRIVGYQVIVGAFAVTVPAATLRVTVPPEFVASLKPGEHAFEVLAIEAGGNQTITKSFFVKR